jgi:hypothetical protein
MYDAYCEVMRMQVKTYDAIGNAYYSRVIPDTSAPELLIYIDQWPNYMNSFRGCTYVYPNGPSTDAIAKVSALRAYTQWTVYVP